MIFLLPDSQSQLTAAPSAVLSRPGAPASRAAGGCEQQPGAVEAAVRAPQHLRIGGAHPTQARERARIEPLAHPDAAGHLGEPERLLEEAVAAKRLDRLEVALAQAQQPETTDLTRSELRMPCDTGSLESITASTCAA